MSAGEPQSSRSGSQAGRPDVDLGRGVGPGTNPAGGGNSPGRAGGMAGIGAWCDHWGLHLLPEVWTPPWTVAGVCLGWKVGEIGKDLASFYVCRNLLPFRPLPPLHPPNLAKDYLGALGREGLRL